MATDIAEQRQGTGQAATPAARHPRGVVARIKAYWPALLVVVATVTAWELVVQLREIPQFILPPPSVVWETFWADFDLVIDNTLITLGEILAGYVLAVAFGIAAAVAVVRFAFVERAIFPFLVASQTVPKIAIAPLIIIWMGTGLAPKVVMVSVIAFFPICINTIAGLRAVEQKYVVLCDSVAATSPQIFRTVRFPYAVPYIVAGLKVATTFSVLGAVVAEWVGASSGLGYLILASTYNFETARVFVGLIALILIGLTFFALITLLERKFSWRAAQEQDSVSMTATG